jgi:hypothetical protein
MTNDAQEKRDRSGPLRGAILFFVLVVYFNFRSPGPTELIDWIVMGSGAVFFVVALIKRLRG